MRILYGLLGVVLLSGCNATVQVEAPKTSANSDAPAIATIAAPAPAPSPSPTPSPSPSPSATPTTSGRSLFSVWTRSDNYYSVDLSAVVDADPSAGISVSQATVWFDFGVPTQCGAHIDISGSEDNGTFSITRVNSGNPNFNASHCDPLLGTYNYVATVTGYRLVKQGTSAITDWQ